ncbi:MAG TPA: MFS transporter [Sphingobium sp.]|nr:MFS transporter [Sphingobium sp.]
MARINVQETIDRGKLSSIHIYLVSICSAIMLVDGLDIYMLGKIAPAVAEDFGVPVKSMAFVFALQQVGLTLGAFLISPLADRFGRKTMLMWSMLAFGVLTTVTVWAQTVTQLAILRCLAGIFLAAVIPNCAALLTELAPVRQRASFVTIAFTGYSAGGAVASLIVIWLLKSHGWQSAFWIGGIAPLLLIPLFCYYVNESIQFRIRRNPADQTIIKTLTRIDPTIRIDADTEYVISNKLDDQGKYRLTDVFMGDMAAVTAVLWVTYFVALAGIALFASWLATFFYELEGVSLEDYASMSLLTFVSGLGGSLTIGWLMDRFKSIGVLVMIYVVEALAIVLMGWATFGSFASVMAFLGWGYARSAGQSGINAVCAQIYPPKIRSTGVGWAFGMGRFGGILAPLLGGFALSLALTTQQLFVLMAVIPLIVAGLLIILGHLIARSGQAG